MNLDIKLINPYSSTPITQLTVIQSIFPAGENHLKLSAESVLELKNVTIPNQCSIIVTPTNASSGTVLDLLLLADAIRTTTAELQEPIPLHLKFDYMPYSRQDRACYEGESNSFLVFQKLFVRSGYTTISCIDVHNPEKLLHGTVNIVPIHRDYVSIHTRNTLKQEMGLYGLKSDNTAIIVVDKGAVYRCKLAAESLGLSTNIVFDKTRIGSKIEHKLVSHKSLPKFDNYIIVDDICDGGATFVNIHDQLPIGARCYLVVSHGIFSKGREVLNGFDDIFVHDNIYNNTRLSYI